MRLVDEKPEDEMFEDDALRRIFNRQCLVSVKVPALAQALYEARTVWIGGGAFEWDSLTKGQQAFYRAEIEALVKGAK